MSFEAKSNASNVQIISVEKIVLKKYGQGWIDVLV